MQFNREARREFMIARAYARDLLLLKKCSLTSGLWKKCSERSRGRERERSEFCVIILPVRDTRVVRRKFRGAQLSKQ